MRRGGGGKRWVGAGVKSLTNPRVLRIGCIVWAPVAPDGGAIKDRRSIIIRDPSLNENDPVVVIGVTSDGGKYDPRNIARYDPKLFFPLPYAQDGSDPTTFTQPCAAKFTWIQKFSRSQIQVAGGMLAGQELLNLLQRIKDANAASEQTT